MATGLHSIASMIVRAAAVALLWSLALGASAQTVRYIHTDSLGSVAVVTDQNRNVIERREYEPYGLQLTSAIKDGPGYTGHVQDSATGLTYMQQRYYDPQIGRLLSVDPVTAYDGDTRQFNRYAHAYNNPYRFTDPDGRQSRDFDSISRETGTYLKAPPPSDKDWLGPAIGYALAGMLAAPVAAEAYFIALANPGAVVTAGQIAAGAAGVTGAGGSAGRQMQMASGKFSYLFGRVASSGHNAARSAQLAQTMRALGISDNAAGRKVLTDHFARVVNAEGNVVNTFTNKYGSFEVRQSLLFGPSGGATKLNTTFQVLEDGTRKFSTTIPLR